MCGGSSREGRRPDAPRALAGVPARARARRVPRPVAAALDGRREPARDRRLRGAPRAPLGPCARGANRPHLGCADERDGARVPAVARLLRRPLPVGSASVGRAPAALHGSRQARVAQASERGAAGPARRLPAHARLRVVVHARLLGPLLPRRRLDRIPDARPARRARRLRRRAAGPRAGVDPDAGDRGDGPRGELSVPRRSSFSCRGSTARSHSRRSGSTTPSAAP